MLVLPRQCGIAMLRQQGSSQMPTILTLLLQLLQLLACRGQLNGRRPSAFYAPRGLLLLHVMC